MNRTITAFCGVMLAAATLASPAEAIPLAAPAAPTSVTSQATPVWYRRGFYVTGGAYYYNGHWFPAAAFAAGVAAATVAPPPPPAAHLATAHVRWCYGRYRSYRAWDNSYQPYGGPRQQCWSPYS